MKYQREPKHYPTVIVQKARETSTNIPRYYSTKCHYAYSLFQALGLWGKSEKAGERGKDERGRRRAKEREPSSPLVLSSLARPAFSLFPNKPRAWNRLLCLRPRRLSIRWCSARFRRIIVKYCTVGYCTVPCARSSSYSKLYWKRLKKVRLDGKSLIRCFGLNSLFVFWLALRARQNRDSGAGGAGGALAPPLLRRMTFYFVLLYGTYKEIKKRRTRKRKNSLQVILPKNKSICQMKLVFKLLLLD